MELGALISSLRLVLEGGPPQRLAVVFGSFARGRARPDSDVDLAIVPVDPELSLRAELALAAGLSRATRREVDLVRLDRGSTLLRWEVARTGQLILEQPPAWVRFRAAAAAEYADFAPAAERAADLFARRLAGATT